MPKLDLDKYDIPLNLVVSTIISYGAENRRMASDTMHIDPVLSGRKRSGFTDADIRKSNHLQLQGLIHSAKYSAAKDILSLLHIDIDIDAYE